jgi:hypothetical protein
MATAITAIMDIIGKYLKRLEENNIPVQKAILFGSYAKGSASEDSDIDLAIVSAVFKGDRFLDRRMLVPLRRGLDSRIEPMPFTPRDFDAGGILVDDIRKTGRIIHLTNAKRLDYQ